MARMPILFTGECTMTVNQSIIGNVVIYTVYIQDANGNPPLGGSTFTVTQSGSIGATLRDIEYPDTYIYEGTFRDPSDPSTNNPYTIVTTVAPGDEVTFTFTPECSQNTPGCSGTNQEESYGY